MEYIIVDVLKEGPKAGVYLVRRKNTGLYFAMKKFTNPEEGKREAKLHCELNHPGIPKIADYFTEGGFFYLIMDYEDGVSLDRYMESNSDENLKAGRRLTAEEIVVEIAGILNYLHTLPVPLVHSDLKPQNIIITKNNEVKLLDFGASFHLFEGEKELHSTLGYAAPELSTGECTRRSDIYSFGMIMIFLFTRKSPDYFTKEPARGTLIRLGMNEEFAWTAVKCIQRKPEARFASGKELYRALKRTDAGNRMRGFFRKAASFILTDLGSIFALSGLGFWGLKNVNEARYAILTGCAMLFLKMVWEDRVRKQGNDIAQEYSLFLADE